MSGKDDEVEDSAYWQEEIADVIPLRPITPHLPEITNSPALPPAPTPVPLPSPFTPRPVRYPTYDREPPTISLSGFDASLLRQLKLKRHPLHHKLDMHDMSLATAYSTLHQFLRHVWQQEAKVALVITGKGSSGNIGELKRNLPRWCIEPSFQPMVVALREALPHHGGAGAYYIQIRSIIKS
jgi:DNA-nicking Smr family endonuclease